MTDAEALSEEMGSIKTIVIAGAIALVEKEFKKTEKTVAIWRGRYGHVPEQPATEILKPQVQERIKSLIREEEVDSPTDLEEKVASNQRKKVRKLIIETFSS